MNQTCSTDANKQLGVLHMLLVCRVCVHGSAQINQGPLSSMNSHTLTHGFCALRTRSCDIDACSSSCAHSIAALGRLAIVANIYNNRYMSRFAVPYLMLQAKFAQQE